MADVKSKVNRNRPEDAHKLFCDMITTFNDTSADYEFA